MARTKISEFSATPGDNTDIDGIDIAEGCAPSGINNAIRELMAQLKDMQTGASGDTFTLTTVNSTTVDTTNLEATNLKAKDGTAAGSIANSTGVVTLASSVLTTTDINGGTIDGVVIGGASAAAATVTSLTDSGNLTFTGTGNRITGDFSSATAANRVSFQSSTTNGNTIINAIPNGTATNAQYRMYNNSDVTNSGIAIIAMSATEFSYTATTAGTGTFLPMTFYTGGSERVRVDTSGNVGIGTTSNLASSKLDVRGRVRVGTGNSSGDAEVIWSNYASATSAWNVSVRQDVGGANNDLKFLRFDSSGSYQGIAMQIDSAGGNVGIGTTSPTSKLSVNGVIDQISQGTASAQIRAVNTGGTFYHGIDTSTGASFGSAYAAVLWHSGAYPMIFATSNAEKMRINSSGNVGIGTVSPSGKLDVVGGRTFLAAASEPYACGVRYVSTGGAFYFGASDGTATPDGVFCQAGGSERMRITDGGKLLVGTTSSSFGQSGFIIDPNYTAAGNSGAAIQHINGSASGSNYLSFIYNAGQIGNITQNGTTGVLYNLTSDYRLKNDPQPLTGSKDFIMALQPKKWQWWDGSGEGVGFIAHEFMEVAKYSGNGEKDAVDADNKPVYQSIQPSSSEVMANLIGLVQEQQALIADLTTRLTALEGN